MTSDLSLLDLLILVILFMPAFLLGTLTFASIFGRPLQEWATSLLTSVTMLVAFCSAAIALLMYLSADYLPRVISLGTWFSGGEGGFSFDFSVDGFALGFVTLATGTCGIVAAFSARYLHCEPGFNRYFIQLALFALGIFLIALAGSAEVLFVGWELLGLSSALLVGFFHERKAPVANALRVFAIYRTSDAAMVGAVILLHHWTGSGRLSSIFYGQEWAQVALYPEQVALIAFLIIIAVAAKSALIPFSGWLPRAMEGPTPSSAVFYGALSIHAGCFLLLRAEPFLAQSKVVTILIIIGGIVSAIYANILTRVQTDVKSALVYSSLTQVAIIVVEIALGFKVFAFFHIVGHICFRLLQFLSAPNILHDLHQLENRIGGHLRKHDDGSDHKITTISQLLYLFAIERGFIDAVIDRLIVVPFQFLLAHLDRFDRLLCLSPDLRETHKNGGDR